MWLCDPYFFSAADDVFSVYAALSSGPQCYLLSSDSFRQHNKYIKLQPGDDKFIFAKWQRLRTVPRYLHYWPPGANYKVGRHRPGTYRHGLQTILKTHKCDGSWHVPVTPNALYNYSTRMPHNHQWLCLPTIWCNWHRYWEKGQMIFAKLCCSNVIMS